MKVLIPLFLTKSDTISYFPADNNMVIYKVTGDAEFEPQSPQGILNEEKLGQYDKYAAFLDGNNGYSVIEGYEEVLFLYSLQGFAKDTRVVYINRP